MDLKVEKINFDIRSSIEDLFHASTPSACLLKQPGRQLAIRPLLLPEYANDTVQQWHNAVADGLDGIYIRVIQNAVVKGQSTVGSTETAYILPRAQPYYVDYYLKEELVGTDSYVVGEKSRVNVGDAFLVTHFNSVVYGHWLLEGMPKLFWLQALASTNQQFKQLTFVINNKHTDNVQKWIRYMIPEADIIVYDEDSEYVVAERLFVPDLWFSGEYFYNSSLNDLLDNFGERADGPAESVRRVYVTRESKSAFREMKNREEIEDIARTFEFKCVSPETRSIPEQIALFRNASIVAGEYGSALHNTLFSKKNVIVVSFNCINSCQSRIAELREQRLGIVLPTDGQPVTFRPNEKKKFYTIDSDRAKRAFERAIEVQSLT